MKFLTSLLLVLSFLDGLAGAVGVLGYGDGSGHVCVGNGTFVKCHLLDVVDLGGDFRQAIALVMMIFI